MVTNRFFCVIDSNAEIIWLQRASMDLQQASYCPQRSWGKVIFSQASVILSTGWGGGPAPGGSAPGGGLLRGGGGA